MLLIFEDDDKYHFQEKSPFYLYIPHLDTKSSPCIHFYESVFQIQTESEQFASSFAFTNNKHISMIINRPPCFMHNLPGASFAESSPSTPARSLSLATDLYKNTVVCLFLVFCAWVRGWRMTLHFAMFAFTRV